MCLKYIVATAGILLTSCAQANWSGNYLCEFPLGEMAGGYYAFIDYDLVVEGENCSLSIDGYQSGSKFICTHKEEGDHLRVFFKDYADRRFDTGVYKEHELLFELVKQDRMLNTHWGDKLYPFPREPVVDQCFKRQ